MPGGGVGTGIPVELSPFFPDIAGRTLQVSLVNQVFDSIGISWTYLMSFAIVSSIPVVLLFLLAQKWFIAGLMAGSVKG